MNDNKHGFKAYNPGLICRGYQYEEGKVYKKNGHGVCVGGVTHYCVNPFDVLDHYPLVRNDGKFSEFTTVEAIDEPVTNDNKKFATSTIKIGVKLGFAGFIKACVDFIYEKTTKDMPTSNYAKIGSSGYGAQIGSSGDYAKIGSSGNGAKVNVAGADSVGAAIGIGSIIKGTVGSWITLVEWQYDTDKQYNVPICVKSAQIDGENLKADTWYKLSNGEFVEVSDEEV